MGKAKRLGILGAVIAVMALVVGAVSPALGSSQGAASTSSDKQQTIRVIARFTEFDANIDVGAPGFSLGDEVVFSGNLLRNGQQVGRIGVVCTFVSTANADRVEAQCPTTSILPGGQITTQGTIVNRSLNFTLPITGGSGQYEGAGGQVVSRDISTPTQPQVELTFHLEF
jgi:Allene oxide cyclase barrel like domain